MRKEIYLALCERLRDLFSHIDLWNENIQFIEQEQAWECPACFIEFLPIQWQAMGKGLEEAEITVRFHIVTRCNAPTSDGSPYQLDAIEYFDLLDLFHARVQRFAGDNFNGLMRIRSLTSHNHEELVESIEEYRCHVVDRSAERTCQTLPPGGITPKIEISKTQ
jgi:hypothetical protein